MLDIEAPTTSRRKRHGRSLADEVSLVHISGNDRALYPRWHISPDRVYGVNRMYSELLASNLERIGLPDTQVYAPLKLPDSAWGTEAGPTIVLDPPRTNSEDLPMETPDFARLNIRDDPTEAWSNLFNEQARLAGVRSVASHIAIMRKTLNKLGFKYGYARPQTQLDRRDPEKSAQQDVLQEKWKRVVDTLVWATVSAEESTRTPKSIDSAAGPSETRDDSDVHVLSIGVQRGYTQRIAELEVAAEEEGFFVCYASVEDFWTFVRAYPSWCQADLILTDEGYLCAIWYAEDERRVEVEFLGSGQARLLVFGSRGSSDLGLPDITAGTLDTIGKQVSAFTFVSIAG